MHALPRIPVTLLVKVPKPQDLAPATWTARGASVQNRSHLQSVDLARQIPFVECFLNDSWAADPSSRQSFRLHVPTRGLSTSVWVNAGLIAIHRLADAPRSRTTAATCWLTSLLRAWWCPLQRSQPLPLALLAGTGCLSSASPSGDRHAEWIRSGTSI